MKKLITAIGLVSLLFIPQIASAEKPSWAGKPVWTGKGKPHSADMEEYKYNKELEKEERKYDREYEKTQKKDEKAFHKNRKKEKYLKKQKN